MTKIARVRSHLRWLPGIPLVAACASDTVPLGGGDPRRPLAAGSLCKQSPVLDASVYVSTQVALEALAGCEEIVGDLGIEVFAGADLSPLAALRVVGGEFQLGAYPGSGREVIYGDEQPALQAQFEQGIQQGYLSSLAGLESLERTGNLQILHVTAPNLAVFANLRSIGSHRDVSRAGLLFLDDNPRLIDLHGLEQVRGIGDVILVDNPELQSLEGLVLGLELENVNLVGCPRLSELGPLASIARLNTLLLDGVGVRNLDALQSLNALDDVTLMNNPELEHVDGLSQLVFGSLSFLRNPKLASLPAFPELILLESFRAIGNAELGAIHLDLPPSPYGLRAVREKDVGVGPGVFDIGDNAKLQSLSLAAGLTLAQHLAIYENPALTRIDLGTLRNLDTLWVAANPSLTQVGLGELQTVDALTVTDNPLLSTGELERVRTFEKVLKGNAPSASPPPGP